MARRERHVSAARVNAWITFLRSCWRTTKYVAPREAARNGGVVGARSGSWGRMECGGGGGCAGTRIARGGAWRVRGGHKTVQKCQFISQVILFVFVCYWALCGVGGWMGSCPDTGTAVNLCSTGDRPAVDWRLTVHEQGQSISDSRSGRHDEPELIPRSTL